MYSKTRGKVDKFLNQHEVLEGECVFTAGDVARVVGVDVKTARKWLMYYEKDSGGWLVGENHPYRKNNHVRVYRIVKGLGE